jgi:hypothetical protein
MYKTTKGETKMNQYIITNHGHTDIEGFEGTWAELKDYVQENYTKDSLCCVKEFHNTEIGYEWEDIV